MKDTLSVGILSVGMHLPEDIRRNDWWPASFKSKFEERAKAMGAAVPESQSLSYELDSEGFKLVADRLVEEAGIHGRARGRGCGRAGGEIQPRRGCRGHGRRAG